MMSENLTFISQKRTHTENYTRQYHDALLIGPHEIYHAYAGFNFAHPNYPENTLYINTLSTFRSYVRGHVEYILWEKECKWYIGQPKEFATIRDCAEKMIYEIIHFSPEYIDYIVIPCAYERLEKLREHYLQIGKNLQEMGIVQQVGYHKDNAVYLKIAK